MRIVGRRRMVKLRVSPLESSATTNEYRRARMLSRELPRSWIPATDLAGFWGTRGCRVQRADCITRPLAAKTAKKKSAAKIARKRGRLSLCAEDGSAELMAP